MAAYRSRKPHAEPLWQSDVDRQHPHEKPAPMRWVVYDCPVGHEFVVSFADEVDVEIPDVWFCRRHGREDCTQVGLDERQQRQALAQRAQLDHDGRQHGPGRGGTPWTRLLQRRSIAELQELLDERLNYLARCRRDGVRPERAPRGSTPIAAKCQ